MIIVLAHMIGSITDPNAIRENVVNGLDVERLFDFRVRRAVQVDEHDGGQ